MLTVSLLWMKFPVISLWYLKLLMLFCREILICNDKWPESLSFFLIHKIYVCLTIWTKLEHCETFFFFFTFRGEVTYKYIKVMCSWCTVLFAVTKTSKESKFHKENSSVLEMQCDFRILEVSITEGLEAASFESTAVEEFSVKFSLISVSLTHLFLHFYPSIHEIQFVII